MAALYISHDLALVSRVADRVAILQQGAIVEEAPSATIFEVAYTKGVSPLESCGINFNAPIMAAAASQKQKNIFRNRLRYFTVALREEGRRNRCPVLP